ncbi:MAG: ABC transporter ATP-binding protein [Christensenellales bacterium]
MPFIAFDNVSLKYNTPDGETSAIKNVTHTFEDGEFTAVVGPSGCGKSTLLHLAAGLLLPDSGKISIDGKAITGALPQVGYMLQTDHLFDWLTIEKNVLVGLKVRGILSEESIDLSYKLLEQCGLADFIKSFPRELSGGMRQRAALVRTLVMKPDILLLDEPFSAIDYQTRMTLAQDVHSIIKASKKTAILVTHDIVEAVSMADSVIVMSPRPGKIKAVHRINIQGTPIERRAGGSALNEYFDIIWKELDTNAE